MTTWYNGDDDHVEHVVEQQGDADRHQDELPLVLWFLHTITMNKMMRIVKITRRRFTKLSLMNILKIGLKNGTKCQEKNNPTVSYFILAMLL